MPEHPSHPTTDLSRRALLAVGVPAAAGGVILGAGPAHGAPSPAAPPANPGDRVEAQELTIRTNDAGSVTVAAADGTDLVRLAGYQITAGIEAREGVVEVDEEQDGTHVIRIVYEEFSDPVYTGRVTYRAHGSSVDVEWEIDGPGSTDYTGGRILRTLIDPDLPEGAAAPEETSFHASEWFRDVRGGVPYRELTHGLYFVGWDERRIAAAFVIPRSEAQKKGATSLHAPTQRSDDGIRRTNYSFRVDSLVPDAWDRFLGNSHLVAGALLAEPDLVVDMSHSATYNLFDAPGPQTFTLAAYAAEGGSARLELVARDYDGEVIHRSTHDLELEAGQVGTEDVDVELPGPRSYVFLEVDATMARVKALHRTGAAVLPPHEFGPPDDSIIGMGGFSRNRVEGASQAIGIEPREDEIALWQRMGVRHLRNDWLTAEESEELEMRTAYQPAAQPEQFADDPEGFSDWLDTNFARGEATGAVHFELLNEWNLQGGIYQGQWAKEYTDNWLLPFREELDSRGTGQKLNSMGLGSWDPVFMDGVREEGGWDALDGVAIHPGRGNFVADYDPLPGTGNTWNYHGAVRMAKAYIDEHGGDKELWLTEIYAMTAPNRGSNDDERFAADNTLLSLALAKAVGVTGVHWFQQYDGTWLDKYGMNPADSEFYYGLMRADRSPKPSLLAFTAISELIDGAEFLGWVESDHPDLRGLRFQGKDGPFWVLWSRQDGYIEWADRDEPSAEDPFPFHPHPEPWDPGRHRGSLDVRIPADQGELSAVDPVGREIELRRSGGNYRIELDGSPIVLRGDLDAAGTGLDDVRGRESVKLEDVTVRCVPGGVGVQGTNATRSSLPLWVETSLGNLQQFEVDKGAFDVTVRAPGPIGTGTQIRVFAEVEEDGQIHRADFYRSV